MTVVVRCGIVLLENKTKLSCILWSIVADIASIKKPNDVVVKRSCLVNNYEDLIIHERATVLWRPFDMITN